MFFSLLLPVGPRSIKIKYLIQEWIVEYGDIDVFLSAMTAAYYVDDLNNKILNAGRRLCHSRKKYIVEIMEEQKNIKKINFFEMLRRLIWVDVSAADLIVEDVLHDLNK